MPAVREFLLRLRPAGAPGSAGPAGVPADASARAADELKPIVAALATAVREAGRIRDEPQRPLPNAVSAGVSRLLGPDALAAASLTEFSQRSHHPPTVTRATSHPKADQRPVVDLMRETARVGRTTHPLRGVRPWRARFGRSQYRA